MHKKDYKDNKGKYQMYTVTPKNNIIILNGTRESFRCRQRGVLLNGEKVKPFKFVSYRTMHRESRKNKKKVYRGFEYNTISKL
jgi:hypothetical protein